LNDLNSYFSHFTEEFPKQLYHDDIFEILDQAKARNTDWNEAINNADIDIFETVSYFKHLENL
jgi:hypothetical protein